MSEFIEHVNCENCGSSDANSLFTDGHQFCFSCQAYVPGENEGSKYQSKNREHNNKMAKEKRLIEFERYQSLSSRSILKETCEKYGYFIGRDDQDKLVQVAPYRDRKGKSVAQKVRGADKSFRTTGNFKDLQLFGQHLCQSNGKRIVITEGELDALSAYQMLGSWPVVSVPNGAQSAAKAIRENSDFLEGFDKVIFCFDMDEPGEKAAKECAESLSPGKVAIMSLPLKDANEMLCENRVKEFTTAFWNAKNFEVDGIVNGADIWDLVEMDAEMGITFPWSAMNEKTYGQRQGELYTWTSGSGMGKSEFVAQVAYDLLVNKGETVGYVALEENCGRTGKRMMGVHLKKPIHLPGHEVPKDEKRAAFEATTGNGRFFMYDHWGSQESDKLIQKIRYMIKAHNCQTIILDHLSIIVSGLDNGDERKAIDVTMTKLRALVEETGVKMHLVSHLRRPSGDKGHENGAEVSLSQLRGSHAIVQLSDFVFGLERDQQSEDNANVTLIRVLKNRYSGDVGKAAAVIYDHETGLLNETDLSNYGDGSSSGALSKFDEDDDDF